MVKKSLDTGTPEDMQSPNAIIENALWKLAAEYPDCRDRIFIIIQDLRNETLGKLNNKTPELRVRQGSGLKKLREQMGMGTREFGTYVGIAFPMINNYENGKARITPKKMKQLADRLGLTVENLESKLSS